MSLKINNERLMRWYEHGVPTKETWVLTLLVPLFRTLGWEATKDLRPRSHFHLPKILRKKS